jgi:predicted Zn-dependent protease
MLDGLVVGDNPAAGIFVGDAFLHPTLGFAFTAPHGWTNANTPIAVATVSPKQDAAVMLDSPADVSNPDQAAEQFAAELRRQGMAVPAVETLTIGGLPARRISISQEDDGTVDYLEMTWVLHRGVTYRLVGIATSRDLAVVRGVVGSFREITLEERASIKVTRLRVAEVRAGETLADVSRRTGNQWDVKTTAVMNGVGENEPLRAGQRIKVARTEVFGGL